MDTAVSILDKHILPKLSEVFGNTLANLIKSRAILSARSAPNESEKLKTLVATICDDHKVINIFGAAQAAKYKDQWSKMLG